MSADSLSRRVLIVDDHEDSAELLELVIQQMGHTTQLAFDGQAAIDAAKTMVPDAALIDIGLPILDGFEVARRLRAMFPDRKLLLVAVTGFDDEADKSRVREAGFDGHIVKPVDLAQLTALLASK